MAVILTLIQLTINGNRHFIKDAIKNDWYEVEAKFKSDNRRLCRARQIFIAMGIMIYIIILLNKAL